MSVKLVILELMIFLAQIRRFMKVILGDLNKPPPILIFLLQSVHI